MSTMRTIRVAWLAGQVALVASVMSSASPAAQVVFLVVALPLLLLAWAAAMSRARADGETGWLCLLLFLPPGITMWLYIFLHRDEAPQPSRRAAREPLAVRQALEVVENEVRRYRGW